MFLHNLYLNFNLNLFVRFKKINKPKEEQQEEEGEEES